MGFCRRWKNFQNKGEAMSELKIPVTSKDHMQGDEAAPVILVEYGDYQCPHCGHAYPIVKARAEAFREEAGVCVSEFSAERNSSERGGGGGDGGICGGEREVLGNA